MPRNPNSPRASEVPSSINYTRRVERNVKHVCKWCKVEVMSKTDLHAVLGHEHKRSCPRRRLN